VCVKGKGGPQIGLDKSTKVTVEYAKKVGYEQRRPEIAQIRENKRGLLALVVVVHSFPGVG
jgi:hypothetical protein